MTKGDESGVTTTLNDAYEKVSETVTSAYSAARDRAADAVQSTTGFDANPVLALVGGLAMGAIAGILIPRGEKERELLAPMGGRIADAAKAAIEAAKSAGAEALNDAGISQDNLRAQSSRMFEQVFKAAGAAGSAAAGAARETAKK